MALAIRIGLATTSETGVPVSFTPRRNTLRGMGSGPKNAKKRSRSSASGSRSLSALTDSFHAAVIEYG